MLEPKQRDLLKKGKRARSFPAPSANRSSLCWNTFFSVNCGRLRRHQRLQESKARSSYRGTCRSFQRYQAHSSETRTCQTSCRQRAGGGHLSPGPSSLTACSRCHHEQQQRVLEAKRPSSPVCSVTCVDNPDTTRARGPEKIYSNSSPCLRHRGHMQDQVSHSFLMRHFVRESCGSGGGLTQSPRLSRPGPGWPLEDGVRQLAASDGSPETGVRVGGGHPAPARTRAWEPSVLPQESYRADESWSCLSQMPRARGCYRVLLDETPLRTRGNARGQKWGCSRRRYGYVTAFKAAQGPG